MVLMCFSVLVELHPQRPQQERPLLQQDGVTRGTAERFTADQLAFGRPTPTTAIIARLDGKIS